MLLCTSNEFSRVIISLTLISYTVLAFSPYTVRNHVITDSIYHRLLGVDWITCVISCRSSTRCAAYNFLTKYGDTVCELSDCGIEMNGKKRYLIYRREAFSQQLKIPRDVDYCKNKRRVISYYLGRKVLENCVSICNSHGKMCAESHHGFSSNALSIFHELGVTCQHGFDTDFYTYSDNPSYYVGNEEWKDRCIGFKNINETINCTAGNNNGVRRLCPCY